MRTLPGLRMFATMTQPYATTRSNGEGCDPVCNSASEKLPMPPI